MKSIYVCLCMYNSIDVIWLYYERLCMVYSYFVLYLCMLYVQDADMLIFVYVLYIFAYALDVLNVHIGIT